VDDILGEDAKTQAPAADGDQSMDMRLIDGSYAWRLLELLIPQAAAQTRFDADTPLVRKLKAAMKQRHNQLKPFYDSGAIGFTQDALVGVRDLGSVPLKQRGQLKNLVDAENRDRNQLYKEIARANGHPEWEKDIRETFSKTWIGNAAKGWWYRNDKGAWVRK
jgi:uncharacterized protein YdbL (DUF1318 family)